MLNLRFHAELNCKCSQEYYFNYNNGGGSIDCLQCPDLQQQSLDGFSCIQIPNLAGCDEANNRYESDTNEDGTSLENRRCVVCDLQSSVPVASSCRNCRPYVFLETEQVLI